ncbi:MAG: GNAT family N-acetyltransferase [Candidatus Kariarchaeaceae archaeon]|jgi:GNAT superfamily N-acetyltransferase
MNDRVLKGAKFGEISSSIVDNYIISWKEITHKFGYPDPNDLFEVNGFISGIPYMMMNSLFDGPEFMTSDEVSNVIQYFKDNHIPMMWFISPMGIDRGIDQLLDELGIEEATMQVPGMAVDLLSFDKAKLNQKKNSYEIIPVKDDTDIEMYTRIFMESFEVDADIKEPMESFSTEFAKYPNASHFLAKMDNNLVATSSVIYAAGVGGIYNVATVPAYRGKGLASALMAACMLDALDRGYQYSILHSSSKGHSVYEKLGYEDYFVFKRYLLRPQDVR